MEEEKTKESQEQISENPVKEKQETSKPEETKEEREMHKTKCTECGVDCEVPFKPEEGRDVLCKDCYRKKRRPRFNKNRRNFRRERQMHDATCGDCGKDCQVPFKPSGDKKVLCKECFIKSKENN